MLPEKYSYRIPGIVDEFWPISEHNPGGCENYGWGATFQTLLIRNVIGYRESENIRGFTLSPALPDDLAKENMKLGITNLNYRDHKIDIQYQLKKKNKIETQLKISSTVPSTVKILNSQNKIVYNSKLNQVNHNITFSISNEEIYRIVFE